MSEHERPDAPEQPTDEEIEEQQRGAARRTALVLTILVLIIAGAAFYYLWNMRLTESATDEPVNVLIVGVADGQADETVEALVLASFHPQRSGIEAVALPVNTALPWTARRSVSSAPNLLAGETLSADVETVDEMDVLRDVYAGGDEDALIDAVQRLLDAPVHNTVHVDFAGFVQLVDLLDGVPVEVQTEVVYRDGQGDVVFQLEPGLHRLNGEEALLYVRYKGDHLQDDSRRVERQWQFAQALVKEARAQFGWPQVQPMLDIAIKHISTDLDIGTLTRLIKIAFDMELHAANMHMLPGEAVDGQWVAEPTAVAALSERIFSNAE